MEITIAPATIEALFWMQFKVAAIGWAVILFQMLFTMIVGIYGAVKK